MEEKVIKRKEWVKTAAIIFLSIMLVLTFFSNTIMNYSLPEVATEYISPDSITMQVRGTGVVEAGDPYNVVIEENRTIKSVVVENGDEVTKGDILFYLEDEQSEEIPALEKQIEQAELEFQQALLGEEVSSNVYNNVQNNVKTDTAAYQNQIQAQKNSVAQIEKSISDTNAQIQNAKAKLIELNAADMDLNTAIENATVAKAEAENAQAAFDVCKAALDTFDANEEAGIENEGTREELEAALAVAQETLDAKKNAVSVADSIVAYIKQIGISETYLGTASNNLMAAKEVLVKLQTDANTELNLSAQKKAIADMKEELTKLKEKSVGGVIKAPISGTVSGISHAAGEKISAGEPVAVMQPEGKGYALSFSVSKKQAATLAVGDRGEISNGWYYYDVVATLLSIKPDTQDPANSKKLTFNIEGDVTPGQTLTLTVGQKSANYDFTVPNNAVREDKDGKFILILEQKPSPLGSRYYAVRRNVEVLSSDDRRSAISGDIYAYEYVVTTSTKPIEEGQMVRLKEQ